MRIIIAFSFLLFLFTALPSDAAGFLQAGLIVRPTEGIDASDRWLISFGSDFSLAPQSAATLGYETATAYYTQDFGTETLHIIPINVWGNVKFRLPVTAIRPVVGGGLGMISTVVFDGGTDFAKDFAFHLLGGLEFGGVTGPAFTVQLQGQKAFSNEDLPFTWILYGGIKF